MGSLKRILLLLSCLASCAMCVITVSEDTDLRDKRQVINCNKLGVMDAQTGVRVFLTVSSLASSNTGRQVERQMELNWFNADPDVTDWIGLFNHDPSTSPRVPLDRAMINSRRRGVYRTSAMFPRPTFSSRSLHSECLGYWAAYVRGNRTLASECIRSRPTWMWDNKLSLGTMRLQDLLVPGTHDSGSYQEYKGKPSENVITRYTICQDENIWNQLVYGIRYLDLRVGLYKTTSERFWLNHGDFKINPLKDALSDIKSFVNATNEVVILDFHRFPWGFDSPTQHRELITLLIQELEPFLLPRTAGDDITLNEIWGQNKKIVLAYGDAAFLQNAYLWNGIPQRWGDKNDVTALKQFLDNAMRIPPPTLWAAMAELTPTTGDIISNPTGSLRNLADKVNRNVTDWVRDNWWDRANVVATDFFLANDVIAIAIEANLKRKMCFGSRPLNRPTPVPQFPIDGFRQEQPPITSRPLFRPQVPVWPPSTTAPLLPSWNPEPNTNPPSPPQQQHLPQFPSPQFGGMGARYPPPVPTPIVSGPRPFEQNNWVERFGPQFQHPNALGPWAFQRSAPQFPNPPQMPFWQGYPPPNNNHIQNGYYYSMG